MDVATSIRFVCLFVCLFVGIARVMMMLDKDDDAG